MPDFREELNIAQYNSTSGPLPGVFSCCRTQKDLADGTFRILGFEERINEGDAIKLIIDFSSSLEEASKRIEIFKKYKRIYLIDEY